MRRSSATRLQWILNLLIVVLFLVVTYLSYAFVTSRVGASSSGHVNPYAPAGKPIQLDVLNGCGVSGIASRMTRQLRRRGFDVIEIRNYRSFDVRETLVIDRVGNLVHARRVAGTLGVEPRNIIQEINPDYFVDVSVVVGKDYATLPLLK